MIVIPDDEVPKAFTPPIVTDPMIEDVPDFDPPPVYVASQSPPINTSTSMPPSLPRTRNKATNYTYISRTNRSIRGSFVIDPLLTVPRLPLSVHEREGNRKNLKLNSRNGPIDADITLLSGTESLSLGEAKRKKRTTIDIRADNGSVDTRLRTESPSGILIPFKLKAISDNGSVTAGLPRDFKGLLTIFVRNGPVDISDEIFERISMSTENSSTCQYFVGDLSLYDDDWQGNEVNLEVTNGRLKVYLVDEMRPEELKVTGGFLSRIWS